MSKIYDDGCFKPLNLGVLCLQQQITDSERLGESPEVTALVNGTEPEPKSPGSWGNSPFHNPHLIDEEIRAQRNSATYSMSQVLWAEVYLPKKIN